MTQEEKELLLKDLCARLPYGVKAILSEYHIDEFPYNGIYCDKVINLGLCEGTINLLNHIEKYGVRPYLRPMSSMTEEEREEYEKLQYVWEGSYFDNTESIDWLNKKMFAYRTIDNKDMFELGLALEAPKDMYNNIN